MELATRPSDPPHPAALVIAYLEEDKIPYELNAAQNRIRAYVTFHHCITQFTALLFDDRQIILVIEIPEAVPEDRQIECIRLLNWINSTILDGCFEVDSRGSHRVRFRHSIPPLGTGLTQAVVNEVIGRHFGAMNLFVEPILRVIQTNVTAETICAPSRQGCHFNVRLPYS